MIQRFRHGGLERFFKTGSKAGIQPHHAARLARQLARLEAASSPEDMDYPGWKLHLLSDGRWSVWINGNWRLVFRFNGEHADQVDYLDYH